MTEVDTWKTYLFFSGDCYEPNGGWDDLWFSMESNSPLEILREANWIANTPGTKLRALSDDWWQVVTVEDGVVLKGHWEVNEDDVWKAVQ